LLPDDIIKEQPSAIAGMGESIKKDSVQDPVKWIFSGNSLA
jgi:hypothetical protein